MDAAVLNDVPEDLNKFISTVVGSYTAWDVLTFFYDTSGIVKADLREVAVSIGRDITEISPALESLSAEKILSLETREGKTIYTANPSGESHGLIKRFFEFTATRQGRLKTIYIITELRFKKSE